MTAKRWRLLFIVFNMPWQGGGTFYRAFGFARELAARGHETTVMATSLDARWRLSEEMIEGVRLVLSPSIMWGKSRTGWDPYEVWRRCRWISRRSFDLVHGFESRPGVIYPTLYAHKRHKAAMVLDWCDWFGRGGSIEERKGILKYFLRPVETFYEEHFRLRAQGTTVINDTLAKRAIGLGVSEQSICWLPNGSDITTRYVMDRQEARAKLGLETEKHYVGYLGQVYGSDAELLISSFKLLRQQMDTSHLIMIGNRKQRVSALLEDTSRIIETEYLSIEDLNLYLAACDVVWLPLQKTLTSRGRWPLKLSDYMATGRATVSTNTGDWVKLFEGEHPIGVLAEDNAVDFVEKTVGLLSDPAGRTIYEKNARHLAETVFAWPKVTDKLEQFYASLLNN